VWEKTATVGARLARSGPPGRRAVLLLHGRTWSSLPVWDLHVPVVAAPPEGEQGGAGAARGGQEDGAEVVSRSFMDLLAGAGYDAYAVDLRGFGGTPTDDTGRLSPIRAATDVTSVLKWLRDMKGFAYPKPALLGWSYGGLVAQLVAQRHAGALGDLVLYGSAYDPAAVFQRPALHAKEESPPRIRNTAEAAVEDFTLPGSICENTSAAFAQQALAADPVKVQWTDLHEFNQLNGYHVSSPTLVIHGDMDPYAPVKAQLEIFKKLDAKGDKAWHIVPYSDHCTHVLESRQQFLHAVLAFLGRPRLQPEDLDPQFAFHI